MVTTGVDTDFALRLHEQMVLIRRFETKVDVLYRQGRVRGPAHLGMGQEAVAVGAASVLRAGDRSIGTYRGHAHALARGAPPEAVLRELLGREGGICAGKGGSMHITSVEHGYYGSYAIIGAHLPIACGMAWADQVRGGETVTVCFFGDGTTNIGAFHEALNMAAVWSLPVVFVCENNHYMEYTPIADVIAGKAAGGRPGRGLRAGPAGRRRQRPRRGAGCGGRRRATGPGRGRAGADRGRDLPARRALGGRPGHLPQRGGGGRSGSSVTRCCGTPRSCPHPGWPPTEVEAIGVRVAAEIERIAVEALAAPPPAAAHRVDGHVERRSSRWTELTWSDYRQAVAAALAQEMARDERVVLLGEDIASGGVFKTTLGLLDRFGAGRVRNTPISETAIAGAAMGAAMAGLRPVAEIMFSDFYGVCWDQIAVEMAKARYMTGGQFGLPLVVRGANGGGLGFGAQHSQAVENWALCVPGLKIVSPATPADAVGLIAAAIRDDDPVLVFEHKALYGSKGQVPDGEHVLPLGPARCCGRGRRHAGRAVATVGLCLAAADRLAAAGVSAEVIDLRTPGPAGRRRGARVGGAGPGTR